MDHKELKRWREQQERQSEKMAGEKPGSRKRTREFLRKAGCDKIVSFRVSIMRFVEGSR